MAGSRLDTLSALFQIEPSERDRSAIVLNSEVATYGRLLERIEKFAGAILHATGGRPARIAVCSEKCVDAYAVELAAVACGATFCPINLDAPVARNQRILRDFRPNLVYWGLLANRDLEGTLPKTVRLEAASQSVSIPVLHGIGESCAYVIYTSGTSGVPKGVQITYSNLEWFLSSVLSRIRVPQGSRWSNHPNIAFDLSILDLFGSVATRSTLFPLKTSLERSFPATAISTHRLNIWHSVPSIVAALQRVKAGELGLLRNLDIIILCGEPCRRSWVEYLLEYAAPGARVYNAYGPTETTVFCAMEEMKAGYRFDVREPHAPLGIPLDGADMRLQVENTISEILIFGPGVGPGYLNLNATERNGYFTDVGDVAGYNTGDLAEMAGGRLYFRGRSDSQVKLRGHRFELTEIESLLESAGVHGAYSVVVGDAVVLFVDSACKKSDNYILDLISKQVPQYARPSKLLRIDVVPRNVNDKVDRQALATIAESAAE